MPWVNPTDPNLGDPTRLPWAQNVDGDLLYLYGLLQIAKGTGIINGSFELDTAPNTNLAPINWALNLSAGNSCAIVTTAANVEHGAQSFSATNPGGITGGVTITNSDFYAIGELDRLYIEWWMKTSVATTTNQVYCIFYDASQALVSTSTLYNASSGNPTAWTHFGYCFSAPTTARFFKLQFVAVNSATAGTTYWDGINYLADRNSGAVVFQGAGTYTYIPRAGVSMIDADLYGAGGGGAGGAATFAGNAGTAGGDTYVSNAAYKARGGAPGAGFATGGGAGPAGAQLNPVAITTGSPLGLQYGNTKTAAVAGQTSGAGAAGGNGGANWMGLAGGAGAAASGNGVAGASYGCGGGGGGGNAASPGGGGGGGAAGENARWIINVAVNTGPITVVVGAGGPGGGVSGGGGGSGGPGADGFCIIREIG